MKTVKRKKKGDVSELIFYSLLIALPILQVVIFYFYVNFNSFTLVFKSYDSLTDSFYWSSQQVGLNFQRLWDDLRSMALLDALKNSLILWFFTTGVGTFLAILFSYYVYKKWALGKLFKFFLFLPSVLPSILLVTVYKLFAQDALLEYVKVLLGLSREMPNLLKGDYLFPTVVFFNVWIGFGAQILIYSGAMEQIAPEIIEAGKVDGVSSTREFFSIVLPIVLPTVSTFVVANVATLFTNQGNLYAFFGVKPGLLSSEDYTIGHYLFILINAESAVAARDMYPYASLLGILCTLIAFPLTLAARKLLNGRGDD